MPMKSGVTMVLAAAVDGRYHLLNANGEIRGGKR